MSSRSHLTTNKVKLTKLANPELKTFAEGRLNVGAITMIDPADIPPGALQRAKNAVVRLDKTSRREGTVLLDPVGPDASPVLAFVFIKLKTGTAYTFRFTKDSIHKLVAGVYTPITDALIGTNKDYFEVVNVLDTIVFANNGANVLQQIDPVGNTATDLGNAPAYRHVTGFYNRVVGAALRGIDETQVGWSADGIPDEWDPTVERSAGFSPILESPSDLSDHIQGIFGFTNNMILLREQSVWLVTKKAIETDPFNFYAVFPGVGCDIPRSIAVIPNGIAWADTRTETIWSYTPGQDPVPIGRPVESEIFKGFSDPSTIFGGFHSKHYEYTIAIPRVGSTLVTTWTYNFRTKAWFEGEYDNISSINDIELVVGDNDLLNPLTIDDLVGTIDQLLGTIDQLVSSDSTSADTIANIRLFGRNDGQAIVVTPSVDTDSGASFETLIDSKVFQIPTDDVYIAEIRFDVKKHKAGDIEIWYSMDEGDTFKLHRSIPDSYIPLGKSTIVKAFGPLKNRTYVWRLRATAGIFDILSFEIKVGQSGKSDSGT